LPAGFSLAVNGFYRNNDQEGFVKGLSSESLLQTQMGSGGNVAQLTHEGAVLGRKNIATLGFEYTRNQFDITNCGFFSTDPTLTSCSSSGFDFLSRQFTKENVIGSYFTDSLTVFEPLILTAGFRYDWDNLNFTDKLNSNLSGSKTYHRVNPKAGLVYTPIKNLSFSFSYSEGIRIPTVSELFAQGPFGSNPNLQPMTSRNFEIGAKGKWADWLEGTLALFYMPVKDEILFIVTDPINFFGRNENISRSLRKGVEISLKGKYQRWLDTFINYTATKATFETDVLLFSGQVRKGDELPLVPRHRVSVGVNVHPLDNLTLSLFGNYVSNQFLLGDVPNQGKKLADYFVLNSRIAYEQKFWAAQLVFNNMTNRKYSSSGIITNQPFFVPAPALSVFAGLSFKY
jgi:iron complex outermembrane receptor protein